MAAVPAPQVGAQPYPRPAITEAAVSSQGASFSSGSNNILPAAFFLGTAGLAAGALAGRAFARRSGNVVMDAQAAPAAPVEMVYTPKETYEVMVKKGAANAEMPFLNLMHSAIMGGAYVGMAGLLSLTVAGNLGAGVAVGTQKFVFAALFPVNLLLVLQSGAQLFTGNTATVSAAFFEGKVTKRAMMRSFLLSWVGNVIGCAGLAVAAWYTGLLSGGTGAMAVATVAKKCGATLGQTIVKAILCNWLVCMAVYLCTQAKDLTGKMVGIWFPISMFVGIGFEHSVANMFMLPAGLLAGSPVTIMQTMIKNLIPVTIGNLLAGMFIIAGGFYFQYGSKK
jgi:formate/nitrite transporter